MDQAKRMMSIRLSLELVQELEKRRRQWNLSSKGVVVDHLVGWMIEEPLEVGDRI